MHVLGSFAVLAAAVNSSVVIGIFGIPVFIPKIIKYQINKDKKGTAQCGSFIVVIKKSVVER